MRPRHVPGAPQASDPEKRAGTLAKARPRGVSDLGGRSHRKWGPAGSGTPPADPAPPWPHPPRLGCAGPGTPVPSGWRAAAQGAAAEQRSLRPAPSRRAPAPSPPRGAQNHRPARGAECAAAGTRRRRRGQVSAAAPAGAWAGGRPRGAQSAALLSPGRPSPPSPAEGRRVGRLPCQLAPSRAPLPATPSLTLSPFPAATSFSGCREGRYLLSPPVHHPSGVLCPPDSPGLCKGFPGVRGVRAGRRGRRPRELGLWAATVPSIA